MVDYFSLVLTLGVFAVGLTTIVSAVGFLLFPTLRKKLAEINYFTYVRVIALLALIATLSVLTYQFIFGLQVCSLCWWQRIFMFPIEIVLGVALYFKSKTDHVAVAILSLIGAGIALYHYADHFKNFVLGQASYLPCPATGLTPSCSHSVVLVFGFVTIPFMALVIFISILWLCFLAHRVRAKERVY